VQTSGGQRRSNGRIRTGWDSFALGARLPSFGFGCIQFRNKRVSARFLYTVRREMPRWPVAEKVLPQSVHHKIKNKVMYFGFRLLRRLSPNLALTNSLRQATSCTEIFCHVQPLSRSVAILALFKVMRGRQVSTFNNLRRTGYGFDSRRPLQISVKFPLIRLPLLTSSLSICAHLTVVLRPFCAQLFCIAWRQDCGTAMQ
jgi:hypothetical protein